MQILHMGISTSFKRLNTEPVHWLHSQQGWIHPSKGIELLGYVRGLSVIRHFFTICVFSVMGLVLLDEEEDMLASEFSKMSFYIENLDFYT